MFQQLTSDISSENSLGLLSAVLQSLQGRQLSAAGLKKKDTVMDIVRDIVKDNVKGHCDSLITCMHCFLGFYKYLENIISVFLQI